MFENLRRIVTAEDKDGKSFVLTSAEPNVADRVPGVVTAYDLWMTRGEAGEIPIVEDMVIDAPFPLDPGSNSATFRFAVIEPQNEDSAEKMAEAFTGVDGADAISRGDKGAHPTMHATNSIDYQLVLSGELVLVTDKEEITVKPGDFVVQGGVSHTWLNHSD